MKTRRFGLWLGSVAMLAGAAIVGPGAVGPATADDANPLIDRSSIDSVRSAYVNWLVPAEQIDMTWSGDVSKCRADMPTTQPSEASGALNPEAQQATLDAINYYRTLAGLWPVEESKSASQQAQQAALIIEASGELS